MQRHIKRLIFDLTVWTTSVLIVACLLVHEALAGSKISMPVNHEWQTECGSCHVAYPPRLLPASAWRRVIAGLDKHFGTDASTDAASAGAITLFLEQNAGRKRHSDAGPETLRITDTAWFRHEHDHVPAALWKNASVRSASNCGACHTTAALGDYRERNIRLPR